jgi:hypothetical protein
MSSVVLRAHDFDASVVFRVRVPRNGNNPSNMTSLKSIIWRLLILALFQGLTNHAFKVRK